MGYEPKDTMRVLDIVRKANGNRAKELQLAGNMARAITKVDKALRRALAAENENFHQIASIFFIRYGQLGGR